MTTFIQKNHIVNKLKIRITNIPLAIENIKWKIAVKFKNLKYEDISSIEYNCIIFPDNITEKCQINRNNTTKKKFDEIIKVFKKMKILKWKHHYYANFLYCDGCYWNMTLTFRNGYKFITSGDITGPQNFGKAYSVFKDYIIEINNDDN